LIKAAAKRPRDLTLGDHDRHYADSHEAILLLVSCQIISFGSVNLVSCEAGSGYTRGGVWMRMRRARHEMLGERDWVEMLGERC
jgi:hypothetical protein